MTTSTAIAVVVVLLAAMAAVLRGTATRRQHVATSRALAIQALAQGPADPQLALLLGLEAWKESHTPQAEQAIRTAVAFNNSIATMTGHSGPIPGVTYSPDGRAIASASYDGTLGVWDVRSGKRSTTLRGHRGEVYVVAYLDDGRLVSGGEDGVLRSWDLRRR